MADAVFAAGQAPTLAVTLVSMLPVAIGGLIAIAGGGCDYRDSVEFGEVHLTVYHIRHSIMRVP
ncbi:MAG: hypothetical protein ACXW39_03005 [Nitrospira sp.]